MKDLSRYRIAILATDGYERSELRVPLEQLRARGASVQVLAPEPGEIRSWDAKDWGDSVAVDRVLADATVADYDALVLPGGQINPDVLRIDAAAVDFVAEFAASGKTVAAICHAPWLLIEADAVRGRAVTSWPSLMTDLINAGGLWRDEPVVVDKNLITSRKPQDLDAFVAQIAKALLDRGERAA